MAVPPADGGSVTHSPDRSHLFRVITIAAAFVSLVCLGVLAYLYVDRTDSRKGFGDRVHHLVTGADDADDADTDAAPLSTAQRDAAMAVARQFLLRANTYGPGDLDDKNEMPGYADRVREVISPKFRAGFDEEGLQYAEATVSQAGYARSAKVYAVGVASIDGDLAHVLAAGSLQGSYPDPRHPRSVKKRISDGEQQFRYDVTVVRIDGTWLVDDFTPVTGDDDAPGTDDAPDSAPGGTDGGAR